MGISIDQPLVALDIGTSKIATLVGKLQDNGNIEVIAVSICPSHGLEKGVVVNIEKTMESIQVSVREAEIISEMSIKSVYVGIAGSHINSINCEGMSTINDNGVTQNDIDNAIDTAQAIQLPADQRILHILPTDFAIDSQRGIKDPIGMSGYRLRAFVHMVTGGVHQIRNITNCAERCGLKVEDIVLEQFASSLAVLTEEERALGVCLLDIGGGTTDIVVVEKGEVIHTSVLPIGGDHVTNDIAVTFRTPPKSAEEIKIKHGCALTQMTTQNETIEILGASKQMFTHRERRSLVMVIEPRYAELFELVATELRQNAMDKRAVSGFVLTGGSSKMEGVIDLASKVFNAPARIGRPEAEQISGLIEVIKNPIHATGVGLLLYAADKIHRDQMNKGGRLYDAKGLLKRLKKLF